MKPPCFNSDEEWQDYISACRSCRHNPKQYCADCTPKYQSKMRILGRCLHPECVFVSRSWTSANDIDQIAGVIPSPKETPEGFIRRIKILVNQNLVAEPLSAIHRKLQWYLNEQTVH